MPLAHGRQVAAHRGQRRGDLVGQKAQGFAQGRCTLVDERPIERAPLGADQGIAQSLACHSLVQWLLQNLLHLPLVDSRHGNALVGTG
ncbi:hypothetical protein FQZ97_1022330 [compost metagenome]